MITIPNDSYHAGRSAAIRLVVLHTAESACVGGAARGVAAYLARPEVNASCHYVVDPYETVAQVAEADTAWTAPGANADGVNIEQAGRAAFSSAEWSAGLPWQMIATQTVPLVADICKRNGLPAVWLSAADLLAGKRGITDHKTVNDAYAKSDHTDCGHAYPGATVAAMVNDILRGSSLATIEDEDMAKAYTDPAGTVMIVAGNTYHPMPVGMSWPATHQALTDLQAAGVITEHSPGVLWKPITAPALSALKQV